MERNVRTLIQELIDTKVEPEEFCDRLEKLLNASPQPCLIGFLKKSLPLLRQSLVTKELVIEGIRPPPANVVFSIASAVPQARPLLSLSSSFSRKLCPSYRVPPTSHEVTSLYITAKSIQTNSSSGNERNNDCDCDDSSQSDGTASSGRGGGGSSANTSSSTSTNTNAGTGNGNRDSSSSDYNHRSAACSACSAKGGKTLGI